MKIAMGSDHVGYELKLVVAAHLRERGIEVIDVGTDSVERTDYPVYGAKAAIEVAEGRCDRAIVICGSGVGISIAANKVPGVRCVACSEPYSAALSRAHNDTNALAFGSRVVGVDLALMIVDAWLEGEYEAGRHARRVAMLAELDGGRSITS